MENNCKTARNVILERESEVVSVKRLNGEDPSLYEVILSGYNCELALHVRLLDVHKYQLGTKVKLDLFTDN